MGGRDGNQEANQDVNHRGQPGWQPGGQSKCQSGDLVTDTPVWTQPIHEHPVWEPGWGN